jgi:flagellar basal-body rod protein FlgB
MKIFDDTLEKLQTSLDLRLERQNLLASNVANADTPGYAPQDIDFAAAMREAEQATATQGGGAASTLGASPHVEARATPTQAGFDGNRVDGDQAMVALAENGLQYNASAQAATKKLAILLYSASDGNG